jgi:hypothetical protein
MAQSDDEIKMNLNYGSVDEKKVRPAAKSISRNFVPRDLMSEEKLATEPALDEARIASRREFFSALLPATGKLLTAFVRTVGTTVAAAVEGKK